MNRFACLEDDTNEKARTPNEFSLAPCFFPFPRTVFKKRARCVSGFGMSCVQTYKHEYRCAFAATLQFKKINKGVIFPSNSPECQNNFTHF